MCILHHIKRDQDEIVFTWSNENTSRLTLTRFRDLCPCANCKGESVMFQTYKPDRSPLPDSSKAYLLKKIELVGAYAIKPIWEDGHNTGIYNFEYLKRVSTFVA